jgi:hypothetical protein
VGNQSKILSSGSEANVYGAQISHRAERRNRNEFVDGLQVRFDFQPVFDEEWA